jgi:hypothetical protein
LGCAWSSVAPASARTFSTGSGWTAGGPSPATSNEIRTDPTSMTSPAAACSARTTPAYGEGSSTTALAVSTSAIV